MEGRALAPVPTTAAQLTRAAACTTRPTGREDRAEIPRKLRQALLVALDAYVGHASGDAKTAADIVGSAARPCALARASLQ